MCTFIIDLNIVMSNIEFLQCDKLEFRQTAGSGHTACPGHTRGAGYEREYWATNGGPGHGVCVHIDPKDEKTHNKIDIID